MLLPEELHLEDRPGSLRARRQVLHVRQQVRALSVGGAPKLSFVLNSLCGAAVVLVAPQDDAHEKCWRTCKQNAMRMKGIGMKFSPVTVLGGMLCLLLLLGACSRNESDSGRLEILSERVMDLGVVSDETAAVEGRFRMRNAGRGTLRIIGVRTECSCVEADLDVTSLAPGQETTLYFKVAPPYRRGENTHDIFLATDGAEPSARALQVKWNWLSGWSMLPSHVVMEGLPIGVKRYREVEIWSALNADKARVISTSSTLPEIIVVGVRELAPEMNSGKRFAIRLAACVNDQQRRSGRVQVRMQSGPGAPVVEEQLAVTLQGYSPMSCEPRAVTLVLADGANASGHVALRHRDGRSGGIAPRRERDTHRCFGTRGRIDARHTRRQWLS